MDKEDVVHIYSAIKKNEIMPLAATWMDLEIVILSAISQQRKTNIIYYLHVESKKKKIQMNLFTKQKQTHRHRKQTYGASLVAQWLGIRLPMQGARVCAPVREDPTCRGAARPVSHNY